MTVQINQPTKTRKQSQAQKVIITDIHQLIADQRTIALQASDVIATSIIREIFNSAYEILLQNKVTSTYLKSFSADFAESYLTENIDMHISYGEKQNKMQEQSQPQNINGDNRQPGSTIVEEKCKQSEDLESFWGSEKQSQRKNMRKMSMTSKTSRILSNNHRQNTQVNTKILEADEFVKLNEKDHQVIELSDANDPYVQELRRLKQINPKVEIGKKQDKRPALREQLKGLEKIGYDFTGDIIKVKQFQKKSTLFTPPIQSIQSQGQITSQYASLIISKPTDLNEQKMKKDRSTTKKLLIQHSADISFSNIRSLTQHLQIGNNARFTQGKTVVEKKKERKQSLMEIKKSMSLNKISRSQFSKLKDVTNDSKHLPLIGSIPSLPSLRNYGSQLEAQNGQDTQLTDRQDKNNRLSVSDRQKNLLQNRSISKSIDCKRSVALMDRSYERVSVQNQKLSEMLIDNKIHFQLDAGNLNDGNDRQTNLTPKLQQLTPRDIANLHYIKTGGTIGKLQFPKIDSLPFNPHSIAILQSKSKLKQKQKQNQLERLKKHFEDKLRV